MAKEPNRHRSSAGHNGRSKAFARPGEPSLAVHHDPNVARAGDTRHGDKSIARNGAPKRLHPVSLHNGATEQQRKMTGMGHPIAGAPDAASANPLDPTVPGKRLTPVQPSPGQRSRTSDTLHSGAPGENHAKGKPNIAAMQDLGRAILAEATCSPDDAMALADYGVGSLPPIVRSK